MIPTKHCAAPLTVSLLALALLAASPATLATTSSAPQHYNIAAASLSQALASFSEEARISVQYTPELTRGLLSAGLTGDYDVDAALAQLLAGSNLQAVRLQDRVYGLIKRTADSAGVTLDASVISSTTLNDETTEGSGRYTAGPSRTATKLPMSQKETPQSVSVITRQQMDDQNMQSLEDVARATTGVRTAKDFGSERSRYFSRGFQVNDLQYDGVPSSISESYSMDVTSVNNMAVYDRVEIVRGANGLLQGAGNPSAAINMVRKRPTDTYQLKAEVGAGSWDNYRAQIDVGGPLNDQGTLRGRTVLMYNTGNSFVDKADKNNQLFYAIGEADLSEDTTVSLGTALQKDYHGGYDWGGLPTRTDGSFYPFSRSTSFATDWMHLNKINRTAFGDVKHRFNEDWSLTINGMLSWSNADFLGAYGYNMGNDQMRLYTNDTKYDDEQINLDMALNGAFSAFGRKHELVFGTTARRDRFINDSRYNNNSAVVDILDYSASQLPLPTYAYDRIRYRTLRKDKGLYVATRLNPVDDLHVILGSRLSWVDYDDGSNVYKENNKVIPYAGIVYDLTPTTSAYASYTDIYRLQSNYGVDNSLLNPITGENYEIGLKQGLFDGRLNTSFALFEVDQSHMPEAVAGTLRVCGPSRASTCYEEGGKVRSRGFEAEVSGEVLPGWNVMSGYTYSHPEYVAGTKKGQDYATDTSPQRLFKLATTYQLPGAFNAWRVGGDLYHQSKIYRNAVEQGAYNLVNLNTQYRINHNLSVQLNVNNLFDKTYYSTIYDVNLGNYYGDPRNFAVTLRYQN